MPIRADQNTPLRRSALLPWVVFFVTAGLALTGWLVARREVQQTSQARFDRLAERVQGTLRRRFDTAALLLHGAAAFPLASDLVTASDWSSYLRTISRQLDDGVVGLGYIEKVARTDVSALEERLHADGETGFRVERNGSGEWMYVVVAIEPREHNTDVLGLDIASGVTRRTAAERAAAENTLILSRRIRLNYDGKDVPGFLLFLPVYQKNAKLATREQRLAALQGWVYTPIRVDQLMAGVSESGSQFIDLDVFEGDAMRLENLLYDADGNLKGLPDRIIGEEDYPPDALKTKQSIDIFGQRWTIFIASRPEFARVSLNSLPSWVLGVGGLFSLLVATLTWALVRSRSGALTLAQGMTVDMRRLALVASHTGNGVIITDPEWRVEWINDGFTRMFGFTLDEIQGRKPAEFMTGPDSDASAMEAMNDAARNRRRFLGEVLNYTKDGRKLWIELEIQPVVNEQGVLEGFMGLQQDITARKRQSEQMRDAMEAAEKANQAKSQFLAMMSHEIRTPMNGVIGMTSLLLDTPLNQEQRESAEIIRQSSDSLLTIINDILDFSKIESGRMDLEQTEFAIGDCVEGALDLLATPAAKKKIELLYEIADDVPTLVVGDAVRLRQVLVNLIGNAVKFTQKGEVAVTVKVATRQDSTVVLLFQVRDTGIGISAEGMERLFKPFSQVDASMTRKFGGTGLGLVISRRLVELMGGGITAESELGRGSVFSFTLRLPVVADGAAIPPGAPGKLNGRCVLIVESNETSRRIISNRVTSWGMKPTQVATAAAALDLLRGDGRYDVVIVDSEIAGMNARDFVASIREQPLRVKLPLILLSAQRNRESSDVLFSAVLLKPLKPTQLFDTFVQIFWPSKGTTSTAPTRSFPPQPPVPEKIRVLFVSNNPNRSPESMAHFGQLNCHVEVVSTRTETIEAVRRRVYTLVFFDFGAALTEAHELAREVRRNLPEDSETWLVAVVSDLRKDDRDAWRLDGIDDCLTMPFTHAQLAAALERAKWRLPS